MEAVPSLNIYSAMMGRLGASPQADPLPCLHALSRSPGSFSVCSLSFCLSLNLDNTDVYEPELFVY